MLHTGRKTGSRGHIWWMRKTLNDPHQTHKIWVINSDKCQEDHQLRPCYWLARCQEEKSLAVIYWRGQGIKLLNSMSFGLSPQQNCHFLYFFMICLHTCYSPTLTILETPFSGSSFFSWFWGRVPVADLALLITSKKLRPHQHLVWENFQSADALLCFK